LTRAAKDNPKDSQGNPIAGRVVYVGNTVCNGAVKLGGQSSGDVNSAMRYDIAQAYIPAGLPGIRIWVEGTEQLGFDLTDHPAGTGVNDAGRKLPSGLGPRYGNSFSNRGNELTDLDVNDMHTGQEKPDQTCP
jgi:hypothetical protein